MEKKATGQRKLFCLKEPGFVGLQIILFFVVLYTENNSRPKKWLLKDEIYGKKYIKSFNNIIIINNNMAQEWSWQYGYKNALMTS